MNKTEKNCRYKAMTLHGAVLGFTKIAVADTVMTPVLKLQKD
jgi:hypothetical protein